MIAQRCVSRQRVKALARHSALAIMSQCITCRCQTGPAIAWEHRAGFWDTRYFNSLSSGPAIHAVVCEMTCNSGRQRLITCYMRRGRHALILFSLSFSPRAACIPFKKGFKLQTFPRKYSRKLYNYVEAKAAILRHKSVSKLGD